MFTNKKITIIIVVLALAIITIGACKGIKEYKENKPDPASQNVGSGEKCIITVQGSKYDVTEFRSKHTGGDVFKCGQDMTEAFQKKHKGYLPLIEKFKITE